MELVDQEFQAIRDDSTRLLEIYPSTTVNAGILTSYYQSAPTIIQVRAQAYKVGFAEDEDDIANLDELISTCDRAGIRTISDLELFLSGLNDLRMTFFKEIVNRAGRQKWKAGAILLTLMLLYGRFPRKFTMTHLTRRGWNRQTVNTIRTCANRSKLNVRLR